MTVQDIVGRYEILGNNQDAQGSEYNGILTLTLDAHQKIIAVWTINHNQQQFGTGFFKDNLLVINFKYTGEDTKTYKGTVVYKFFNKENFEGFWSEKHANQAFLGLERGTKIEKELLQD
jgi:hypothetical protein|tara:strand:+ start:1143 stop:1499 length:357 start_codon:yes stop_codon:yes gene_type:complete